MMRFFFSLSMMTFLANETNCPAKITNEATSSKYNLIFLCSKQQLAGKFPHHNASRSAHVEAVFGAQLRNFQAAIA